HIFLQECLLRLHESLIPVSSLHLRPSGRCNPSAGLQFPPTPNRCLFPQTVLHPMFPNHPSRWCPPMFLLQSSLQPFLQPPPQSFPLPSTLPEQNHHCSSSC